MEKLTLRLIKNKNGEVEYSVLEQSAGIERKEFRVVVFLGAQLVHIRSFDSPEFSYEFNFIFYIRGRNNLCDHYVQLIPIDSDSKQFLDLITRPNIQKIKESLAQENIDFNLVTNLYSKSISSKF
jgi:hypothetical protein